MVGVDTDGTQQNNNSDIEKAASSNKRLEDLEITIRRKLFELLLLQESSNDHNSDTNSVVTTATADVVGAFWKSFLDLCHHLVHHAFSSSPSLSRTTSYENLVGARRLPYLLLSDCIEGLHSLEDAQRFWSDYVEPELVGTVLFGDVFWSQLTETNNSKKLSLPNSHLPFLKVANQFLKRLEHASDNGVRVEWKGRIMWALSKGFSIADKSSLKSWGNFHADNGTVFESKEEFNTSSTNTVEYNLYEAFWSLQNDFANPNKLNVGDFIKRLRLILAAMESATATSTDTTTIPEYGKENGDIYKQTAKFLTSSALLPSQIQNRALRSSVVTQFLIVASHLGAESPPLKNALASLLGRARKLLKNDNPQLHGILWESILVNGREDHWRTWKKQKCAASAFAPKNKQNEQISLDSAAVADHTKSQQKRRRTAKEDEKDTNQEEVVSSLSYNFLDNSDLVAVSKDLHNKLPTLEEHLESYVEALDPESGIEDEYHPKNDSLFTWRAMRLYAKHQLPLMSQCRQPADLEKITREWYRQSHRTEIPGEMPSLEQSDNDDHNKMKDDAGSADDQVGNNLNDNKNDIIKTDSEMKDSVIQEDSPKQGKYEKNQEDVVHTNDVNEDKVNVEMEDISHSCAIKVDQDPPKADNTNTSKREREEIESEKAKQEDYGSTEEICYKTESSVENKATTVRTDGDDERRLNAKNTEISKLNTAISTTTDTRNNDKEQNIEKGRNNKNDSQRQEKRPPRENVAPQNRSGGWRGNDGGRNNQERVRRDDDPTQRRRSDDNHQLRMGERSGGDSSYRGRLDGPSSRGGRYDDDYRSDINRHQSDIRGERYTGERTNRPTGRDNHRAGDRGGSSGRADHRSGERGRNIDNRSRGGGGGGARRRR